MRSRSLDKPASSPPTTPRVGVVATMGGDHVVLDIDGSTRIPLRRDVARGLALHLLELVERAAGVGTFAATGGRPLVWDRDGYRLQGDGDPLRDGDSLYAYGPAGWLH